MNALRSPLLRRKLNLLASAAVLFALGMATGQIGQARSADASPQLRPVTAELPTVRHSDLQLIQRQRWVF